MLTIYKKKIYREKNVRYTRRFYKRLWFFIIVIKFYGVIPDWIRTRDVYKEKNIKIDIEVKISSKREENLSLIHFQNFEVIPVIYVYLLYISYII